MVKLANRIESLRLQDTDSDAPDSTDIPANAPNAAGLAVKNQQRGISPGRGLATDAAPPKSIKSRAAKSAIFREVVLAKVREMKEQKETQKLVADATAAHERRKSYQGPAQH